MPISPSEASMLPKHGIVYGAFLLAYVARVGSPASVEDWVKAARGHGSFLAYAVDLQSVADALIECRLARLDMKISVDQCLADNSYLADDSTLRTIARQLLIKQPPLWLKLAVRNRSVAREYIPANDLEGLQWLEPNLDALLVDVSANMPNASADLIRQALGDAGELVVLSALRRVGLSPIHVAQWSDSYGYDIEVRTQSRLTRLEVKAAGPKSRGRFYLSRNEFEKSQLYGSEWLLLQVVFTGEAFVADELRPQHIEGIYQLSHGLVGSLVPPDTRHFKWMDSALIEPAADCWELADLSLEQNFVACGLGTSVRG